MTRYLWCLAIAVLAGTSLRAGELDEEFAAKSPATPTVQKRIAPVNVVTAGLSARAGKASADGWKASEMDAETPTQAWHGGWGGCGWRGCGWRGGWGGYGWGGWRGGWGGYGWGGWGGYGWRGWGLGYYPSYFGYGYGGYPGWGSCW